MDYFTSTTYLKHRLAIFLKITKVRTRSLVESLQFYNSPVSTVSNGDKNPEVQYDEHYQGKVDGEQRLQVVKPGLKDIKNCKNKVTGCLSVCLCVCLLVCKKGPR